MRKFENYLVLFVSMLGMILADSDDENNTDYQQLYTELLDLHNEYRPKHGAKELILSKEDAMLIAKNFGIEDETNLDIGVNVFYEDHNSNLSARTVFFTWYNVGENYTYNDNPRMRSNTSSFTQIVWKDTEKLGLAVNPEGNYITIVATYSPRGNTSDYLTNVVAMKDRKDDLLGSWGTKKRRSSSSNSRC